MLKPNSVYNRNHLERNFQDQFYKSDTRVTLTVDELSMINETVDDYLADLNR